MSEEHTVLDLAPTGPDLIGACGASLAKLALVGALDLTIFENLHSQRYDFAVATRDGMFLRIEVATYVSNIAGIARVDLVPELRWPVAAAEVCHARASITPVLLFLFDATTRHGRFARLDTLPAPPRGAKSVLVSFPAENVADPAKLASVIAELRAARRAPTESSAA